LWGLRPRAIDPSVPSLLAVASANVLLHNHMFNFLIIFFSQYVLYLIAAGVFAWLFVKRKNVYAFIIVFAPAVFNRLVVTEIIRLFVYSARPFVALHMTPLVSVSQREWYGSFPSGHAIFLFSLATSVWLYDKRFGAALYALALAVGICRVFALLHWPADIFAGAVLGIILTIGEITVFRRMHYA